MLGAKVAQGLSKLPLSFLGALKTEEKLYRGRHGAQARGRNTPAPLRYPACWGV